MCCKFFWKGIVVFTATFVFGSGLININSLEVNNSQTGGIRTICTLKSENENSDSKIVKIPCETDSKMNAQSLFFNPPKSPECISRIYEMEKEKASVGSRLSQNENASKKQISAKKKQIEEIELKIRQFELLKDLHQQNPDQETGVINLLYKENCYDY